MNSQPETSIFSLTLWALRRATRKLAFAAVLITTLLKTVVELLKPWPVVILIDYVLQGKTMPAPVKTVIESLPGSASLPHLIVWTVVATIIIFFIGWITQVADDYATLTLGQRLTYDLGADLYGKLLKLSLQFHASKSVGDNIRRVTSDATCVSTIVKDAFVPLISALVALIAMFAILWGIDPTLTLLSIAIAPLMALSFFLYAKPMMDRGWKQQEIEGRGFSIVEQTLAAIPIVQAFTRERDTLRRFRSNLDGNLAATLSLTNVQVQFKLLMAVATGIGTAAVLWVGARHALAGTVSIGGILLFLSYLASLYTPLQSIMYTSSIVQNASGSARRVMEILQADDEITDTSRATSISAMRGEVQIENVTVGYERNRAVLHDLTLTVHAGETLAFVGSTGAGKTTLAGLLPRFLEPWQGRVLIDGKDIRDISLKNLRSQIAIVSQDPFLFPTSIAENIAYGSLGATEKQIEAAAKAAVADSFIQKLPLGYETVIGERGATLSGGERQRIAIARALLKEVPILILDEPTSALDAETEAALLQAMAARMKDRTTLIIAHRLSTARCADRIVVLNAGEIAEVGTERELLARGGLYAGFYKAQVSVRLNQFG